MNIINKILGNIPVKAHIARQMGTIPQTLGYVLEQPDKGIKLGRISDTLKATQYDSVIIQIHESGEIEIISLINGFNNNTL
jgi:hypothetical protein